MPAVTLSVLLVINLAAAAFCWFVFIMYPRPKTIGAAVVATLALLLTWHLAP